MHNRPHLLTLPGGWCPPPSSPWMMSNEPHHLGHQLGSDSIIQAGHRAHTFTPRPHTPRPPRCWGWDWVNVRAAAQSGTAGASSRAGQLLCCHHAAVRNRCSDGAEGIHAERRRTQRVQRDWLTLNIITELSCGVFLPLSLSLPSAN